MLGALGLDQRLAVGSHLPREDGLAPLGTPDEVVDDEVDPEFIALILHVDSVHCVETEINGLKPEIHEKPA
jgi:hypothetical protein